MHRDPTKGMEAIFSATPHLESLRSLLLKPASEVPRRQSDKPFRHDRYKIMLADFSRAHVYATAVRDVFIQLPSEDPHSATPGACGKLEKTMYGTRDAVEQWANHYVCSYPDQCRLCPRHGAALPLLSRCP